MFDSVRPRDSGKSSAAPDHPRVKRRPVSWHIPRSSGSLEQRLTSSARAVRERPFSQWNSGVSYVQPREQAVLQARAATHRK